MARKSDGTVWAWGNNTHGELGDGTAANRSDAVKVLNLTNIVSVSGGDSHSSALAADGTVWKWGLNDVGELGIGATNAVPNPVPVKISTDVLGGTFSNVVMLSARDYHNIAVKADGSVWMWGANDQGQCGVGATNDVYLPAPVFGLSAQVPLQLRMNKDVQAGAVDLEWNSAIGQYFSLDYTTNLAVKFTPWQSNILATPNTNRITVPLTNPTTYYRLRF